MWFGYYIYILNEHITSTNNKKFPGILFYHLNHSRRSLIPRKLKSSLSLYIIPIYIFKR